MLHSIPLLCLGHYRCCTLPLLPPDHYIPRQIANYKIPCSLPLLYVLELAVPHTSTIRTRASCATYLNSIHFKEMIDEILKGTDNRSVSLSPGDLEKQRSSLIVLYLRARGAIVPQLN